MKIKVCGMRDTENISSLIGLKPDFVGFIFYQKSKRFVADFPLIEFPESIKKVGVFVNEEINEVVKKVKDYQLDCIQLHGNETVDYCDSLCHSLRYADPSRIDVSESQQFVIIKAFSINDSFDFTKTEDYQNCCDYFLFDTKGKDYGGSGLKFNWETLQNYKGVTPYFLSGGIGLEDTEQLLSFLKKKESIRCYAIDVNSRFEDSPGLKNIEKLKEFKFKLQ